MAATLSFSPFPLDHAGSTRMLKDFLHESNGNGNPKTASLIHAVVAAVKRISFPSLKSPRILPRSLSRRLLRKRGTDKREIGGDFVVKVKDIIRWRSFRDLVDDTAETAAQQLDFADSPDRYTAAATTRTTTTATSSNSSSWCESDFTAEDSPSPSWRGCSDNGEVGKIYFSCVGEDSTETTATNSENDRKANVVVSRRDDKEEEENVLEDFGLDWLSLELFGGELMYSEESQGDVERVKNTKNCTTKAKEDQNGYEWFLSQKGKEAYVKEMEREGKWGVFGYEEKLELGFQIEGGIFGCLVHEILLDIFQLYT